MVGGYKMDITCTLEKINGKGKVEKGKRAHFPDNLGTFSRNQNRNGERKEAPHSFAGEVRGRQPSVKHGIRKAASLGQIL